MVRTPQSPARILVFEIVLKCIGPEICGSYPHGIPRTYGFVTQLATDEELTLGNRHKAAVRLNNAVFPCAGVRNSCCLGHRGAQIGAITVKKLGGGGSFGCRLPVIIILCDIPLIQRGSISVVVHIKICCLRGIVFCLGSCDVLFRGGRILCEQPVIRCLFRISVSFCCPECRKRFLICRILFGIRYRIGIKAVRILCICSNGITCSTVLVDQRGISQEILVECGEISGSCVVDARIVIVRGATLGDQLVLPRYIRIANPRLERPGSARLTIRREAIEYKINRIALCKRQLKVGNLGGNIRTCLITCEPGVFVRIACRYTILLGENHLAVMQDGKAVAVRRIELQTVNRNGGCAAVLGNITHGGIPISRGNNKAIAQIDTAKPPHIGVTAYGGHRSNGVSTAAGGIIAVKDLKIGRAARGHTADNPTGLPRQNGSGRCRLINRRHIVRPPCCIGDGSCCSGQCKYGNCQKHHHKREQETGYALSHKKFLLSLVQAGRARSLLLLYMCARGMSIQNGQFQRF